ncbi:hypothetical protein LO772_01220 [Yinghuangia sp. ASG 101]|uniref:hypothetical protein n=1 Tax=Yinghuangia sp. ASG 101 TaxID=2896848 RepID=UPI001E4BBC52|nr:hypothetical protein [Yinghuangia sp. ASG 101]UGQ12263.1 hypothetical protein LO772_01220 [Yinghuangia sp. ASG 101]
MTALEAHWAYWSKDPGDDQDYRVLACSTGEPAHFTALVHAESPGTPRTEESGRPGSLPWVAFGSRRDGRRDHCSIAVMDWTDDTDWTNRRITATRWMTLPYDELSAHGAEFGELYQAVLGARLHEGAATTLELPAADARSTAARDSGAFGGTAAAALYWAAGVAALLLEGRVVITGAGQADAAERVAAIDAVARMLPYGYRADLTACTWTPVPEQVRQRLCFADYMGDGLIKVPWQGRPPRPSAPVARRYLELLTGHLDAGEGEGVLGWLGENVNSRPFSEPARALEVLEALTLPELVVAEVRSGQGDPDRVLKALRRSGLGAFDSEARRTVFAFLFERRDPSLFEKMARYPCPELHDAAVAALHAALLDPTKAPREAAAEATALTRAFVLPLWDDVRQADAFVAALLSVPRGGRVPDALVDLWVRGFVADPERAWPSVGSALLYTPPAGMAAIRLCARDHPDHLPRLMGLLSREAGGAPWLTVLRWVMAPDDGAASASTLAQAVEQCPDVAVEAYRLAVLYATLDAVPVPLWQEWLRIADDDRLREHAELGAEITDHGSGPGEPATLRGVARLGLLRTLYKRSFGVPTAANAGQYVRELADSCRLLPHQAAARHRNLAGEMLQGVVRAYRARPEIGELTVAILLAALDHADDIGPDACRVLAADALDPARGLQQKVLDALASVDDGGASAQRLLDGIPELAAVVRVRHLERDARAGRPAEELAAHWSWLIVRAGDAVDEGQVRRALQQWLLLPREGAAYELLLAVRANLVEAGRRAEQADEWLVETMHSILTTDWLGRSVADGLRGALVRRRDRLRDEERQLTRMIGDAPAAPRTGGGRPPNGGQPYRPSAPAAPAPPGRPPAPERKPAPGAARPSDAPTARYSPFGGSSSEGRGERPPPDGKGRFSSWRGKRLWLAVGAVVVAAALAGVLWMVFGSSKSSPSTPSTPSTPPTSASPSPGASGGAPTAANTASPAPSGAGPVSFGAPASLAPAEAPRTAGIAGAFGLILVVLAAGAVAAAVYRRPRWSGGLTTYVRRDTASGSGYQVAGVLVRGRLGRAQVHGQSGDPYVLRLPRTTARVTVSARRAWRRPSQVDLLVRVRLADSGRQDSVLCPVGGRRMVLGLDVRHDPAPVAAVPPRPEAPPPGPASYPQEIPGQSAPTMIQPFPPATPVQEGAQTVVLPPPNDGPRPPASPGGRSWAGEISGGPETGGPRTWPPN